MIHDEVDVSFPEEAMNLWQQIAALCAVGFATMWPILSVAHAADGAASAGVIEITTPMPAPDWALLERELLRSTEAACREFYDRYFDDRGYWQCVERWGGDDGNTRSPKRSTLSSAGSADGTLRQRANVITTLGGGEDGVGWSLATKVPRPLRRTN